MWAGIWIMPIKGWHHSEESKLKMAKSREGLVPWNKGITYKTEQKINLYGHTPWNKGLKAGEETRQRLSESHKGYIPSDITREKLSLAHRGRSLPVSQKKKIAKSHLGIRPSTETRLKLSESHRGYIMPLRQRIRKSTSMKKALAEGRVLFHKPNKAERKLESILDEHFPSEWRFVGDGSMPIGGLFPDFIHCNGKNLIIEFFGDYWHGRTKRYKVTEFRQTEYGRRTIYARYGYALLVIWESELGNESGIVNRVKQFLVGQVVGG